MYDLDKLAQKFLPDRKKYENRLISGFRQTGFKIKKIPAFETVTEDFNEEEDKILHCAENS